MSKPTADKPNRIRVAVISGGGSAEQAIGSVGASDVLDGLDPDTFQIVPLGVTHDGRWVLESGGPGGDRHPAVADAKAGLRGLGVADVVFPVLRGGFGDGGTVQGLLEMAGLPYVGSGVFAASATSDRAFCRTFAAAEGVPVVPHVVLRPGQELTDADRATLGLPVVIRPSDVTAGEGVPVSSWDVLDAAVAIVRGSGPKVVVESVLAARTVDVSVREGAEFGEATASVPAEGDTVPADLPHDVTRRLAESAVRAFAALECSGVVRVTFKVTADGGAFLDGIDPMPEFAADGVVARMWAASGVSYTDLVSSLITTALRKGTSLH